MPMDSTGAAVLNAVRLTIPRIPPTGNSTVDAQITILNNQQDLLIQTIAADIIQHIQTNANVLNITPLEAPVDVPLPPGTPIGQVI